MDQKQCNELKEQLRNCVLYACNVSYNRFCEDLYDGKMDDNTMENLVTMRNNFSDFYLSLDDEIRTKFVTSAMEYYRKH